MRVGYLIYILGELMSVPVEKAELKHFVDEHRFVDIHGVRPLLLEHLVEEGYNIHLVKFTQLSSNMKVTVKVLTPSGVSFEEVWKHRGDIKPFRP
jgi:hypothetical protein